MCSLVLAKRCHLQSTGSHGHAALRHGRATGAMGLYEAIVTCTSLLPPAWSPPDFAVTPLSSAALSQPPCPSHWADCAENPGSSCASGCCAGKGGLVRKFKPGLSPGSRQSCESDAFGWVPPMPWAVLVQGMTFGEPGGVVVTSAWAPRENIFPLGDW